MPLNQPLPSTWTSQHVIADTIDTNIAANDFIISNDGSKFGTTGNTYIPLKMPFATFYMTNQGAGTAVIVISRASDGVPLYATAIQPVTSTTGDQVRIITLPCDSLNALTITMVKTGTVSVSIVVSGVTDPGLLPYPGGEQAGQITAAALPVMGQFKAGGSSGVAVSGLTVSGGPGGMGR